MSQLTSEFVKVNVIPVLRECFDQTSGIFLDKNTSLLQSISSLSAEQASRNIIPDGSSIAAHVSHIRFYLKVLNDYIDHKELGKIDWKECWKHREIDDIHWDKLRVDLASDYRAFLSKVETMTDFGDEKRLGGILAIIAHSAFHLGAIRQMVLVVTK